MSTTQFAPQLRPLSVGEVLDASFKVVRSSFGTLAACVLVVALPLNIVNTLITASTSDNAFNLDSNPSGDVSTGTALAGSLLTTVLSLVLTTLAAAACFRAVSSVYLGEQPTVGESLSFAASKLLPLIVLSILFTIGLIPAFLLLILPGIWLAVAWSVGFPAMLSEGLGPAQALGRSFRLVKGRWWPTFGAVLVMYLIVIVISGILGVLFGATLIASLDSEAVAAVIYTIVNTLSSLITLPLFAAVLTIIYFDLRVRKEGFDLHLLARGVGSSAPATSPESVATSSGLGAEQSPGGFAPPQSGEQPSGGGGFAPPQAPSRPAQQQPDAPSERPASAPPPSQAPPGGAPAQGGEPSPGGPSAPSPGGMQSGDPLAPPPERREGDGGAAS
jgi:hypothetical protein